MGVFLSMKNAREKTRAFEIVRTSHHGANVAKGTRHPDDVGGWVPLGNQERQLSNGKIRCVCIFIIILLLLLSLSIARDDDDLYGSREALFYERGKWREEKISLDAEGWTRRFEERFEGGNVFDSYFCAN